MKTFDLDNIIRKNIRAMKPYSSARSEFKGNASVMLDANENSIGSALSSPYNRYPDPLQKELKSHIGKLKNVSPDNIFIGNGSDEPIDLLIRATCNPGKDNILIFPPTYGMYEVAANINDVAIKTVLLTPEFQLDVDKALQEIDADTRLVFICSPNNPTGNFINEADIVTLLHSFNGIVVLDEAYIDFSASDSFLNKLADYPNLVILQTFSKAWGLAGLRLGVAYASVELINILNKIKAPYNINLTTQQLAIEALSNGQKVNEWIITIQQERTIVKEKLQAFPFVKRIYPSDSNFLLIEVSDANDLYDFLLKQNIVVRNRNGMPLCGNCLRITIGTPEENVVLLDSFKKYIS